MSIWERIGDALSALVDGEPLSAVFEKLRTPPEQTVAFTIAVIALGAKMAKADGQVTRDEVAAFRRIFTIPEADEPHAARIFNMARRDVGGFDGYARQVARMFSDREEVRIDILEGLVAIAIADGEYHPKEDTFLREVCRIFDLTDDCFRRILARHLPDMEDPYEILGLPLSASDTDLKERYRMLVKRLHPDQMVARGVPEEARRMAEQRLATVNNAYETILQERKKAVPA
ncbi:MAG: molecular chaperone DjiA [Pseudomonadota bacterium]